MPESKELENQLRTTRTQLQELEKSLCDQLATMRRKIDDELLRITKEAESEKPPKKIGDVVDPQTLPEDPPFDPISKDRKGTGKGEKN